MYTTYIMLYTYHPYSSHPLKLRPVRGLDKHAHTYHHDSMTQMASCAYSAPQCTSCPRACPTPTLGDSCRLTLSQTVDSRQQM